MLKVSAYNGKNGHRISKILCFINNFAAPTCILALSSLKPRNINLHPDGNSLKPVFTHSFLFYCIRLLNGRLVTPRSPGGVGVTPLYRLYGDVSLDRVWFLASSALNRVYNFKKGYVFLNRFKKSYLKSRF